ncbi:MAG: hypothetical protein AMXMBFR64_13330 [Myxococcales bacterium]
MGRRVLCVSLPALRLERLWSERPGLQGLPLVLYEARGNHEIVVAASPEAAAEGVLAGLTVTQARARCEALRAVEVDGEADARALCRAAEALLALSPTVALDPPALLAEVGDTAHLFGGEEGAGAEAVHVLAALGHLAQVAVADGPDVAWAVAQAASEGLGASEAPASAARVQGEPAGASVGGEPVGTLMARMPGEPTGGGAVLGARRIRARVATSRPGLPRPPGRGALARVSVVEPGQGRAAVAALPVALLRAPAALVDQLRLVGVRTAGQLAALPRPSVLRRFGAAGERAWRIASGDDDRTLDAFHPDEPIVERAELESPCESLEPLAFVLKGLLDRAHARMAGRGVAALRLVLTLGLDGADDHEEEVTLARPLRAAPTLLAIARERLASVQLEAPVLQLSLRVAEAASFRGLQLDLLTPRETGVESLDELLARLTGAFGVDAVFAPSLADRWRPEGAWARGAFTGASPRASRAAPRTRPPARPPASLPLALLPVPEPIVWDSRGGRGLVRGARWQAVEAVLGPERLAGEWWGAPFDRDYWVVRLGDGARWWIFRDRQSGEWRLHGVFE